MFFLRLMPIIIFQNLEVLWRLRIIGKFKAINYCQGLRLWLRKTYMCKIRG